MIGSKGSAGLNHGHSKQVNEKSQKEVKFKGLALSEGVAIGRVCLFNEMRHSNLPDYKVEKEKIPAELERMHQARDVALEQLRNVERNVAEKVGRAEAEIFVVHRMILEDETLHNRFHELVEKEGMNAESAVSRALEEYERKLAGLDNEYINERASDFGEIKRRMLDVLRDTRPDFQCADQTHCQRGRERVVVAEELTPAMATDLDTQHTMAFVTERGGIDSHAAILARALGIPAVSGIRGIRDLVGCGTELLVDGDIGEVIVWPRERTVTHVQAAHRSTMRMPTPVKPVRGFKVMANISMAKEIEDAVAMKAEGVGLYRTEIELIAAGRMLSEDELVERYTQVFRAMKGHEVVYRLFDIGSDKTIPTLDLPREENPSLGWRGSRLLLGKREILAMQARVLARVSQEGPIDVLYPMIIDRDQFVLLKAAFLAAIEGVPYGEMRHGAMFEVPSAALQARELFEVADFGSVGTNDLTQYLFAVDRNNEQVAYDYNSDRPVFWNLLGSIAGAARKSRKPLSICGELAADPRYIGKLQDLGIDTVSVSVRRIPGVRVSIESGKVKKKKGVVKRKRAGGSSGKKHAKAGGRK